MVLLPIVVSAEDPIINKGTPTFTVEPTTLPVVKETLPIVKETLPLEKPVYTLSAFTYTEKSTSIFTKIVNTIKGIVGIPVEKEEVMTTIDVEIDGAVIATIPKGSKFENMGIHEICVVPYQFGTDGWFKCEVSL